MLIKKYVRELGVTKVKKYIVICFSNHERVFRAIGKHFKKNIRKYWKGPNFFIFEAMGDSKKDVMNGEDVR